MCIGPNVAGIWVFEGESRVIGEWRLGRYQGEVLGLSQGTQPSILPHRLLIHPQTAALGPG